LFCVKLLNYNLFKNNKNVCQTGFNFAFCSIKVSNVVALKRFLCFEVFFKKSKSVFIGVYGVIVRVAVALRGKSYIFGLVVFFLITYLGLICFIV